MKSLFLTALFSIFFSLSSYSQVPESNNPIKYPLRINKLKVDSLEGKPIEFYLKHAKIDTYAKLFYKGEFAIADDTLTFAILDSLLTLNTETRAFYLYIFNCAIRVSNVALSEYLSAPCRAYFEEYPCEFRKMKTNKLYHDNYKKWLHYVAHDYMMKKDPNIVVHDKANQIHALLEIFCNNHDIEIQRRK